MKNSTQEKAVNKAANKAAKNTTTKSAKVKANKSAKIASPKLDVLKSIHTTFDMSPNTLGKSALRTLFLASHVLAGYYKIAKNGSLGKGKCKEIDFWAILPNTSNKRPNLATVWKAYDKTIVSNTPFVSPSSAILEKANTCLVSSKGLAGYTSSIVAVKALVKHMQANGKKVSKFSYKGDANTSAFTLDLAYNQIINL